MWSYYYYYNYCYYYHYHYHQHPPWILYMTCCEGTMNPLHDVLRGLFRGYPLHHESFTWRVTWVVSWLPPSTMNPWHDLLRGVFRGYPLWTHIEADIWSKSYVIYVQTKEELINFELASIMSPNGPSPYTYIPGIYILRFEGYWFDCASLKHRNLRPDSWSINPAALPTWRPSNRPASMISSCSSTLLWSCRPACATCCKCFSKTASTPPEVPGGWTQVGGWEKQCELLE